MRKHDPTPWLVILVALLVPVPLAGTTYFVDRFDDDPDADACTFQAGDCSLRGAVRLANSTATADVIQLANGTYQLTIAGAFETEASMGDLDVKEALTISVLSGATATIVQTTDDRVFHLATASASLSLLGPMTIQGGFAPSDSFENVPGDGGSIAAEVGTALSLTDVTLSGASASSRGGCLFSDLVDSGNSVTLTDVLIQGCSAEQVGGGAYIAVGDAAVVLERVRIESSQAERGGGMAVTSGALAIVRDSILRNNTADDEDFGGRGGGLAVFGNGQLRLSGSSIVDNAAGVVANPVGGSGGGLYVAPGALVQLRNSTVSGNRTRGGSPAAPAAEVAGTLEVDHATVVDNQSEPPGSRAIWVIDATLTSEASIVEGGCQVVLFSSVTSQGYNVERPTDGGMTTQCNLTDPTDVFTNAAVVRPLAGNGGPTPTHALVPGSPAHALVPDATCAAQDQRHAPRSLSFCDAGSYESSGSPPGPWLFSDGFESGDTLAWPGLAP